MRPIAPDSAVIEADFIVIIGKEARARASGIDVQDADATGRWRRIAGEEGPDFIGKRRCYNLVRIEIEQQIMSADRLIKGFLLDIDITESVMIISFHTRHDVGL